MLNDPRPTPPMRPSMAGEVRAQQIQLTLSIIAGLKNQSNMTLADFEIMELRPDSAFYSEKFLKQRAIEFWVKLERDIRS